MLEKYPNLKEEVGGGSIPGCDVYSLFLTENLPGGQMPHVLWRWPICLLSQEKKEKKKEKKTVTVSAINYSSCNNPTSLSGRWHGLEKDARVLNVTLQTTKKQFVEFTEQQALDFVKVTVDFRDRMNANGPVKCDDLDIGLALLVEFQARALFLPSSVTHSIMCVYIYVASSSTECMIHTLGSDSISVAIVCVVEIGVAC
jgi:hypothetical protein